MASELYQEKASSKQLYLDPQTKILLCLSVSTTLIAGNGTGYLLYLHYALAVLPLIFLLILRKFKAALYYVTVYAFALFVPDLIMPYLPNAVNLLFTGVFAFSTKLIPGTMMAYFLFAKHLSVNLLQQWIVCALQRNCQSLFQLCLDSSLL